MNLKTSKSLFLLGTAFTTLSLGACSVTEPNFMPRGYTNHGEIYKSKTPPPSQRVTNEQRSDMGPVQAEQFRSATYDILTRLTSRAGLPPKPVYIEAVNPMTPFYANIDNDLREAMRSQGYRLADSADGAYIFKYNAELLPGYRSYDLEKAQTGSPNIKLTLDVLTDVHGNLKPLTHEVGNYYITGAEGLLIPVPNNKFLPLENETRYVNEAGSYEPRTENTYHSGNQLETIQPVMDKTKAPVVDIIPPPQEYIVTMPPVEPVEVITSSPPVSMEETGSDVQIFDPSTSEEITNSYDYSASMNDMNSYEPVRRGPRISKQVEY